MGANTLQIILIDTDSGYIWGDSSDLDGDIFQLSESDCDQIGPRHPTADDWALAFARALDESLGERNRTYVMQSPAAARNGQSGYMAYRNDINGSEAVGHIRDGQDKEVIEMVERDCQLIGFIAYS
jgi:hypothetical protein